MVTPTKKRQAKRDENRAKNVTLEDVAKVAGVTSMTVSRVIKGKGYVAPATRETVLRIAKELNYTANLAARALATGRTGAIAVISGSLNLPYSANMVFLIEAQLHASGYQMRLLHTKGELQELVNSTNASAVDGVIVVGLHNLVDEFRAQNLRMTQPCVYIGLTQPENVDYVHSDLVPAVVEVIEAMISAGRKRIVYAGVGQLDGSFNIHDTEVRTRTYVEEMQRAGRVPELVSASPSYDVTSPERLRLIRQHFETHGCPDAILCINDDIAVHIYRVLMDMGLRIPDDVALVGCDGLPIMEFFEPPLSTIAQPMEEMCAQAWKYVQARIAQPDLPAQQSTFKAQLIRRKSLPF